MSILGKLKLPHKKHTADIKASVLPTPATVNVPTSHYIGAPAIPTVKIGDKVFVGTKIAEADGRLSAAIHSPVSGTVKKLCDFLLANGKCCQSILIESDGEMTPDPTLTPPTVTNADELCKAARDSGIVGFSGAGLPIANTLEDAISHKVDTLIINGAESEPYITADNRAMIESAEDILSGVGLLSKYLPAGEIVIAIEADKTEAISKLSALFANDSKVTVKTLPASYPQGADTLLVYNLTGRIVPEAGEPTDVGCAVINVSSVANLARYIASGAPYTHRIVTVDGSAVRKPTNVIAPIGASIRDLLVFADADLEDLGKVIYGGPMMGVAAYSIDDPIFKNTTGIVALNKEDCKPQKEYPCIHCGKCIEACPVGLNPTAFVKAMKLENRDDRAEALMKAGMLSCIGCGACSYVCPSRRPLVQNNKLAKNDLLNTQAMKKD